MSQRKIAIGLTPGEQVRVARNAIRQIQLSIAPTELLVLMPSHKTQEIRDAIEKSLSRGWSILLYSNDGTQLNVQDVSEESLTYDRLKKLLPKQ